MILNDYLYDCQTSIAKAEILLEKLKLRLLLIRNDYAVKNDYEKNEVDIKTITTSIQIDKLQKVINEKRADFKENFGRYMEELRLAEKNTEDGTDSSMYGRQ